MRWPCTKPCWPGCRATTRRCITSIDSGKSPATVYLFNCRSLRLPITAVAAFSNPWIWAGAGLQLTLQMAITCWAPLNAAFATAPIDARAWGEIAAIALAAMGIIELEKRWRAGRT